MSKLHSHTYRMVGSFLAISLLAPLAYAQTTTTTVEQSTTQVQPAPVTKSKKARAAKPVEVTNTTVTTTQVESAPQPLVPRKTYNEDTLRKISKTLCTEGFKTYLGRDKSNLCLGKASPPDIAYSCVWDKKGTPVYPPTVSGPCNLDFAEHKGNVSVKGTQAECCFRAASGPALHAR